jgi:hypothetical protein
MLEKLTAVSMSQKFLNLAMNPTKANLKRMESLGLNEAMLSRVLLQVKTNAKSVPNAVTGRKLKSMGFENWSDAEAFEAYRYALNRWGARLVQQNLLGESHPLMSTDWGKTLFQFRNFVMVGYEKQLMHNLMMADKETLTYALSGTFIGGLAYVLQTEINSVGRADADKFKKERLSPEAIGAAAFQRSGMATMIPGTVDSLMGLTGRDPIFGYRSTGLDSNFLTGNPTVSTTLKAQGALRAVGGMTNPEYDFSKVDARNLQGLTWFSNAVGLRNLFEIMQHDLPTRSTRD